MLHIKGNLAFHVFGHADRHGKLVSCSKLGAREGGRGAHARGSKWTLEYETVEHLSKYLIFHVAGILLHDLPVVNTDRFNTHTNGFGDVRDSPCSDGDALRNVEAASQSSWNFKVLSS